MSAAEAQPAYLSDPRLTAHALHLPSAPGATPELVVEAVRDGWWYTAALPGGRRVVVCLTDPDIASALGLRTLEGWTRALAETRHMAALASPPDAGLVPRVWPAGGRRLAGPAPPGMLCAGDAAASFDPVSAAGVPRALRSGLFAAYAAADLLLRGDVSGVARFQAVLGSERAGYERGLAAHYGLERRWPQSPFWRRRQVLKDAAAA